MKNQLNLDFVFVFAGAIFLISGLFNYIDFRLHKKKYKTKTLATITSCKRYIKDENSVYESIFHSLTLKFKVDSKAYQVTKQLGREAIGSSKKQDYFLVINDKLYLKDLAISSQIKKIEATLIGKQVRIYCNPNNPKDVDLDINNYRKNQNLFAYIPLSLGVVGIFMEIIYRLLK